MPDRHHRFCPKSRVLHAYVSAPWSVYGFEPAGFRLTLGLKDIDLALAAGQDVAVPLPLGSLIRHHYLSAVAQGLQDSDWSALAEVMARCWTEGWLNGHSISDIPHGAWDSAGRRFSLSASGCRC